MAEALLTRLGRGAFHVFSAGNRPANQVSAHTLETLRQAGYDVSNLEAKSWNVFVKPTAPNLDVVVTLDPSLKNGPFPIWYSNPVHVHWPFVDPHTLGGDDTQRKGAHRRLYGDLEQQILKLLGLNLAGLDGYALRDKLSAIAPKT